MTPQEESDWREFARLDLLAFCRWMFRARRGTTWRLGAHHYALCAALMRVYSGDTKRLIINMPPRYSKTEFVVNFMAWALGHHPDSEFIYSSYSGRLAAKSSWECRSIVQHPEYQALFPCTVLRDDSSAKDEWRTTDGGMVYAVGAGGTITGYGAGKMRPNFGGCIIVDDPHKADEATSEVMRENVWDWFQGTLESRTNNPDTPIVVIMQRLHEDDLAGHLIAGHNGEEWEVLKLAAIKEDGKALWPFKHSIERLEQMREASPYVFSGQYMQEPSPPTGGMFETDRIEVVDALPAGIKMVRAWDPAYTNKATSCDTAGALLGVFEGTVYIQDITFRKTSNPDDMVVAVAQMDGHGVTVLYPQDPGAGVKVLADLTKRMHGYDLRSHKPTSDKVEAWLPFASQVNGRNVKMVRGEWNRDLLNDLRMAPFGKRKDLIDAVCYGYQHLALADTNAMDAFLDGKIRS